MTPERIQGAYAATHDSVVQVVTESRSTDTASTSSARILIAEDNPVSAELLRSCLESWGYAVDWAHDGDHALAMAATGQYHVLLLDVHMPVYDGVEVMRRLHLLMGRRLRVIAVTADRLASRREEMVRMGIDGYLTKPVNLTELRNELNRVLGQSAP